MGWQDAPVVGGAPAQQRAPQQAQPRQIGGTRVLGGVPASEQRAQQDQAIQIETLNRTTANQQAQLEIAQAGLELRQNPIPSGYEPNPSGEGLRPIPGGPADPSAPQGGAQGNAVSQGAADKAEKEISQYTALLGSLGTFDDNFGGNWAGGLENTAQAYLPEGMAGTPGQSEWWANFRRNDNQIRNELFGATLTPSEQAAYAATSIDPGMNAAKIRANLQSRTDIIEGALNRRYEFYLANGYRREAVDALFAPLLDRMGMAGQTTDERDQAPPALGGAVPPAGNPPGAVPPGVDPNGDGRILGNTHDGGSDTEQTGIETGRNRREDDPVLAGVRDGYTQRLMEGQSPEQLLRYLREAGATVNQTLVDSVREQAAFRAENPGVPAGEYNTSQLDDRFINVDPLSRGLGNVAQSPVGTYAVNAGDAVTGFNLDSMVGMTGGNAEQARAGIDQVSRENPTSALLGQISGGTLAALTGEAGLARAGVTAAVPRALMADSAYGAVAGAGATDYAADGSPATMADRAQGGAMGAVAGLAGSYGGQRAGNALAGMARGGKNAAVNALRGEGVNALTVGQSVGGSGRIGALVKGAEDRLAGIPVVGDMINARRTEGIAQLNTRAFDKALEPIGGGVQGKVGQAAVEAAQEQVSQAFTDALEGVGVQADDAFARDLGEAVQTAGARLSKSHPAMIDDIAAIFEPFADDDVLSGEALQIISRELRDLKSANRMDARFKVIANSIDRIERTVFDLYDRQASGVVPAYNQARQAYRRLATLEDAVMKAQNQTDQMFTPAQLNRADTASGRKLEGRRAAARGATPFNDMAVAAQEVMPNKVPDSGTAGRMLVPLALVGTGGSVDAAGGGGAGLTIGGILAGLYTRTGQRILTKGSRGMTEGTRRRAVLESTRTKRAIQMGTAGGSAALVTNQQ